MPEGTLSTQLGVLSERFELIPQRREEAKAVRVLGQLADSARKNAGTCRFIAETLLILEEREYLDAACSRRAKQSLAAVAEHAARVAEAAELKDLDSAVQAASEAKGDMQGRVTRATEELEDARDDIADRISMTALSISDALKACGLREAGLVATFDAVKRKVCTLKTELGETWLEAFDELREAAFIIEQDAKDLELFEFEELLERFKEGGVRLSQLNDREIAWLQDKGIAERLEVREIAPPASSRQRKGLR